MFLICLKYNFSVLLQEQTIIENRGIASIYRGYHDWNLANTASYGSNLHPPSITDLSFLDNLDNRI